MQLQLESEGGPVVACADLWLGGLWDEGTSRESRRFRRFRRRADDGLDKFSEQKQDSACQEDQSRDNWPEPWGNRTPCVLFAANHEGDGGAHGDGAPCARALVDDVVYVAWHLAQDVGGIGHQGDSPQLHGCIFFAFLHQRRHDYHRHCHGEVDDGADVDHCSGFNFLAVDDPFSGP